MRCSGKQIIWALLFALSASSAWAYEANVGDRAANFKGFDVVARQVIELDDYLGQWVLVEHWASWCGPCDEELSSMVEQTRHYVTESQLQLITICNDSEVNSLLVNGRRIQRFWQVINKLNIDCPVLYDGGQGNPEFPGLSIPALEWNLRYVPASFLINPQGVIVMRDVPGENLKPVLDYLIGCERPLVGLCGSHVLNDDGSLSILADVMNTGREPVEVILDYHWENWVYNKEDPEMLITDIVRHDERAYQQATITFDEFCNSVHEFVVEMNEQTQLVDYHMRMVMPNTQGVIASNPQGIELRYSKYAAVLRDIDTVDGTWRYSPGVLEVNH